MMGAEDELAAVMARADQAMYARKAQRTGLAGLPAQRVARMVRCTSHADVGRRADFPAYLIRSRRCSLRFSQPLDLQQV